MRLHRKHEIEALERRRLLSAAVINGVLVVTGTESGDMIVLSADDTHVHVDDNGVVSSFDRAVVSAVHMMGLGGNDMLQVLDEVGTFFIPVHSEGGAGDDFVDGGAGNDLLEGGDGNDFLFGYTGDDTIVGGAGGDFVVGMAGNDMLSGGTENDNIYGGEGNDTLFGDDGDDNLNGDDGDDDLHGNLGADTLTGGDGFDRFMEPDASDSLTQDGVDVVWVPPPPPPPPPPPEECPENTDKNPNWKRGHCNKPDHDEFFAQSDGAHGKKLGHYKHGD